MDSPLLQSVGHRTRRSLRLGLVSLALAIIVAVLAAPTARTNRHQALLLLLCGLSAIFGGRFLRASDTLLRLSDPPAPRWVGWAVAVSYGVGVVAVLFGGTWLVMSSRTAP
jgi:hypothetical protein